MQEIAEYGFILKSFFPSKQTFSVLTPSCGKVNLFVSNKHVQQRLRPGMLIEFSIKKNFSTVSSADNVDILMSPQPLSRDDMYWVHHLLELCYYFIPQRQPAPDLFSYLGSYLNILPRFKLTAGERATLQTLCTVHFLVATGHHDYSYVQELTQDINALPDTLRDEDLMIQLSQHPALSRVFIKRVRSEVLQYLKKHPSFSLFKTVRFMYPQALLMEH